MDNKTKEAIKQLQADMRQLQALLTEQRRDAAEPAPSPDHSAPAKKDKSDTAVQYFVQYRAPDGSEGAFKTGTIAVTNAQLGRVTDEETAMLGYALSSSQKVGLLRALLTSGSASAAALGQASGLSTGSLYHHLHDLMHAGVIAQSGRNRYILTPRGRRVLLVLLALTVEP